jgi:hypothetical protein
MRGRYPVMGREEAERAVDLLAIDASHRCLLLLLIGASLIAALVFYSAAPPRSNLQRRQGRAPCVLPTPALARALHLAHAHAFCGISGVEQGKSLSSRASSITNGCRPEGETASARGTTRHGWQCDAEPCSRPG